MIFDENYKNFFYNIFQFYNNNINDVSQFDFNNIFICDDIKEFSMQLGIEANENDYNSLGATILPYNKLIKMIVIIVVTNQYGYEDARRLIHELTHVYDYMEYAKYYSNGIIRNFRKDHLYRTYENFSEFHAFSCDEIYAYKYKDNILNENGLSKEMRNQDKLLSTYINSKRQQLLKGDFCDYDLFQVFGKIYAFDKYNQIENVSESLAYKYIPMLFHNKIDKILLLYQLCYISLDDTSIFLNLTNIDVLSNSIITNIP